MQDPPPGANAGWQRPLMPGDVRAVVFATTRMRLGYDIEEVDAFLDHVEWSMERALAEIHGLRQHLAAAESSRAAAMFDARVVLEQALARMGGPTGSTGRDVLDAGPPTPRPVVAVLPPPTGTAVPGLAPPPGVMRAIGTAPAGAAGGPAIQPPSAPPVAGSPPFPSPQPGPYPRS